MKKVKSTIFNSNSCYLVYFSDLELKVNMMLYITVTNCYSI